MVCKFILLHGAFILIFFFFFLFVCIPLLSVSPACPLQLCNGGSVTELVKGLLMFGQRLDEAVISYILYGALLVRKSNVLGMTAEEAICHGLDPHFILTRGNGPII